MISNNINWVPAHNSAPNLPQRPPSLNPTGTPGMSAQYPNTVNYQRTLAPQWTGGSTHPQNRGLTEMLQDSLTHLNLPRPPANGALPPNPKQPAVHQTPIPYQPPAPQGVFLTLPAWMQGKGAIPPLYQQVCSLCADPRQNYYINTDRIQPVLLSSKLDKEKLKLIWSLCNQTVAGVLTLTECYSVLGLVALAQQGHEIGLDKLASFSFIPIPALELAPTQPPVGVYPQGVQPPRPTVPIALAHNDGPIQTPHSALTSNVATTANYVGSMQNTKNDTFGEFQSATKDRSSSQQADMNTEFGELTSAPPPPNKNIPDTVLKFPNFNPSLPPSNTLSPLDTPPLLPTAGESSVAEDKYSYFREISTSDDALAPKATPSVFSGGAGVEGTLLSSADVSDKYAYLRALDETSIEKSQPPLLSDANSNSPPAGGLSELKPQMQSQDLSFFEKEQKVATNKSAVPPSVKQDNAAIFPKVSSTEISYYAPFTCSEATSTRADSTRTETDFFDPKDFSAFHSASDSPTCVLPGLELITGATESKRRLSTPENPPTLPAVSIYRTESPLTRYTSFQTAAVATDPKTLLPGSAVHVQNPDTFTAPPPTLDATRKDTGLLDGFIPLQSAASAQESSIDTIPQSSDYSSTALNPDLREIPSSLTNFPNGDIISNKKQDTLNYDVFHSAIETAKSDSVLIPGTTSEPLLIPTSIGPITALDSLLIPTNLQSSTIPDPVLTHTNLQSSTIPDPVLTHTNLQSSTIPGPVPTHTNLQSSTIPGPVPTHTNLQSSTIPDPVPIHTNLQSSTIPGPVPTHTNLQSSTIPDPVPTHTNLQSSTIPGPVPTHTNLQSSTIPDTVLPIEPSSSSGDTQKSDMADILINTSQQNETKFDRFTSGGENFSLHNEPPPLDDAPPDDNPEEKDIYNFSGFHSYLPDEVPDKIEPTNTMRPDDTNTNPGYTTIFSALSAAVLPDDVELELGQDVQPLDTTPLAPPADPLPDPSETPPTDLEEQTPLAVPGPMSFTDQAKVGGDNPQDLVFNVSDLNSNSAPLNEIPLPPNPSSNSNTNSLHPASQPLNPDPDTAPSDPDPFVDLEFLSSIQTGDLMKGQSSNLAQPKWTLFDTFSNALQDLNSVPIDKYKNQKFRPKKEISESFPKEERLSYRHDVGFEAFTSAAGTKQTDAAHMPLVRAPSYKLSEDSNSELREAWSKLLSACSAAVHTCLEKVKSATSVHVLKELCSHQKSREYFEAVFEVMKIMCRVKRQVPASWEVHNLTLDDADLDWANIKSYLNHGGLQFSDIPTEGPRGDEATLVCGVCLNEIGESECRIPFGGFDYHNTCANFWLNEVENMLPRLSRESLAAGAAN